jgi:hypothetical protein
VLGAAGFAAVAAFGSPRPRRRRSPRPGWRGRRVGRGGVDGTVVDRAVRQQAHGAVERIVEALEQRVLAQDLFDLLVQLERRQLQQADRLLELRCQRKVL